MFGYVKERVVSTVVSATIEVLKRKGHTFNGSVTIGSDSLIPLLEGLSGPARLSVEDYIGDGLLVEFTVRFPAQED